MDHIVLNVRYAVRRLLRTPAFALVAILSLGLGIGANTAMFSLVNAVILRDLPFEDPETLVDVYESTEGFSHGTLSYPDYEDLVEGTGGVFGGVSGSQLSLVQADVDGGVEVLFAEAVTGNYFSLVGVDAVVGRVLSDEDHVAPGAHPVVVLGHGYWRSRRSRAVGRVGTISFASAVRRRCAGSGHIPGGSPGARYRRDGGFLGPGAPGRSGGSGDGAAFGVRGGRL